MKIECPHLVKFPDLKHAFFAPSGKNNPEEEIRSLPLVTLTQVHGNTVHTVKESPESKLEGDGLVTNVPGLALGIFTADCAPVLFYDPNAQIIGACHAGWRGAKGGIIAETLKAMIELGATQSQIYASIGPTIQQQNYEVGPEFPEIIGGPYDLYFCPSQQPGHHFFNLPLYIQKLLAHEAIPSIHDLQLTCVFPWSNSILPSFTRCFGK